MRSDGRGVRRITSGRFDESPAWSPNGKWIVFSSTNGVELVRSDGSGRHIVRGTSAASDPAWSPNGRLIAYVLPDGGIATIPAVGGKSRFLSPGLRPVWDPSSDRIAYTRWPPNNQFSVWVMNANGSGKRLVMRNAREPAWAP